MQVQYDGTAYLGFASQDLEETVENHLFNALIKLKLIEDRKVSLFCARASVRGFFIWLCILCYVIYSGLYFPSVVVLFLYVV